MDFKFFILFLMFIINSEQWQKRIGCNKLMDISRIVNKQKIQFLTCQMSDKTEISTQNHIISTPKNDDVHVIDFYRGKKINFLPEKVYEKFPNLLYFDAQSSNISELVRGNFEKLYFLKEIQLHNNHIEKIPNNAFADLQSLELLRLSK